MFQVKPSQKQIRKVGVHKTTCSRCDGPLEPLRKNGYCLKCHAERMRLTRPKHSELPEEARKRANARSYANVYLRRGKIQRKPCEVCGSKNSQMHHDNYDKPTVVRWFCREHHLQEHKFLTSIKEL